MDFQTLLNDYNGSVLLEPGTAEWGYVEPAWYLQVPYDTEEGVLKGHKIGTDIFDKGLNFAHFIQANFTTLNTNVALGNPDKALFGALLRSHLVRLGCLESDISLRCVIENEYSLFKPMSDEDLWLGADCLVPNVPQSRAIASFVKKYGDTLMHMMVYVFVSRGHHWQDEYDGLYNRLFAACGIQKPNNWNFPTNRELFRQIMHCFGVKLLLDATNWCKINNRMANPIRLRFSPNCPVAGAAQITTLNATLVEMMNEGWYSTFDMKFHHSIDVIKLEVTEIAKDPYSYHVASRVVTGKAKRDLRPEATQAFKVLCQYALGYIDHLGRRHSLANQKVITQKSGGHKPIAEAFAQACDKFGKPDTNVDSMKTFIQSL